MLKETEAYQNLRYLKSPSFVESLVKQALGPISYVGVRLYTVHSLVHILLC